MLLYTIGGAVVTKHSYGEMFLPLHIAHQQPIEKLLTFALQDSIMMVEDRRHPISVTGT